MFKLYDQVFELNSSAKMFKKRADAALEKVQTVEKDAELFWSEIERLKKELTEIQKKSGERLEEVKADHATCFAR